MKHILLLIFTIFYFQTPLQAQDYNIFSDEEEIEEQEIYDPFEGLNRKIYKFNIFVDKYTAKPTAKLYRKIVPKPARNSISNALSNLKMPLTAANSLLQLDFKNAIKSVLRFTINSTIGVLGFFDVATKMDIVVEKEDFGQTLAKYKVGSGPYLMLPFLGPSFTRDIVGRGADGYGDPFWHVLDDKNEDAIRFGVFAVGALEQREKFLDILDDIEKNSLDPYSVIKSSYAQRRHDLIENNATK